MEDVVLIFTTTGSMAHADDLASRLVEPRLAACVNILNPVRSVYRWKDSIERGEETLLLIKTVASRVETVRQAVQSFHAEVEGGYELPEFLVMPISGGSPGYLSWLRESSVD